MADRNTWDDFFLRNLNRGMDHADAAHRADEATGRQHGVLCKRLWNASLFLEAAREGCDSESVAAGLNDAVLAVREAHAILRAKKP